jgi:hypothetical protein
MYWELRLIVLKCLPFENRFCVKRNTLIFLWCESVVKRFNIDSCGVRLCK